VSIIIFLIVLAILVLAHELGHFLLAKREGVRVEEFGFGFPPRLFSKKKGETVYSFNAIPFGGFVKMKGEDGDKESIKDSRSFSEKSFRARAYILVAGVAFNLILAWVIISINLFIGMPTHASLISGEDLARADKKILVVDVSLESPAKRMGLEIGDEIIGFGNIEEFQKFVRLHQGEDIKIIYKRGGEKLSTLVYVRENPPEGEGSLGIAMNEAVSLKYSWYKAPIKALEVTTSFTYLTLKGLFSFLWNIVKGTGQFNEVIGPVGIVGATSSAAQLGFSYLLAFTALLSINLAVINILPFPALDGGRLLFMAIEKVRGKNFNEKTIGMVHTAGFGLLVFLMLLVTYKDIARLF